MFDLNKFQNRKTFSDREKRELALTHMCLLDKTIRSFLKEIELMHKEQAIKDKLLHISGVVKIVRKIAPDNTLAVLAAKYHDVGRFPQFESYKKFDDRTKLHHEFGRDLILDWLKTGKVCKSEELDTLKMVVEFHGRKDKLPEVSESIRQIVDLVSIADDIENGCIGAIGYLYREASEDTKNFKRDYSELDMKQASSDVFNFFSEGKKFDKLKFCKTYADYVLFAATLAIQALKDENPVIRETAKSAMQMPCGGYNNALEGYRDLFRELIESKKAEKCYRILQSFYETGKAPE